MSTLIAIAGLGILSLVLEILNLRKILVPLTLLLLAAILGMTIGEFLLQKSFIEFDGYNMIITNGFSCAFSSLFILLAMFIIGMSSSFYADDKIKIADYVSLKLFLLAGAVAMVSFGNMAMFFLGLEVLSIAVYVLAASRPRDIKSNEAGMKYFIMGAFASSFVLFGIAFIYGATGSFDVDTITTSSILYGKGLPIWYYVGFVMISVGMLFKASIFPFHFWAPDVYEGSPTLTTALMSTLVKVSALAAFFKIVVVLYAGLSESFLMLIMVLAVLTMFIGNITALKQSNIKRMMAYSGVSHAGFMLMTLLVTDTSSNTLLFYATAYSLAGIAAFAVILAVCAGKDNQDIENFNGLARRQPLLALCLAGAMLSLGGIPVFSGFFAKFFLFDQMLNVGHLAMVVFGILNSVIAVYYYFKMASVMFVKSAPTKEKLNVPFSYSLVAVLAIILNILLGIFPSFIMGLNLGL